MKTLITVVMAALLPALTYAQKDKDLPGFGKIDKADLEMTTCEFDKDAEALILIDYGNTEFQRGNRYDFAIKNERRVRLKILKKSGLDRATVKIRFYSDDNYEKLMDVDAVTYNLDASGNIVESRVDKKSFFKEKVNANVSALKFAFPEVKVGSIIEYRYTIIRESIQSINPWVFQDRIPTRVSAFRLAIPEYFNFTTNSQMSFPAEMKKDEFRQSIAFSGEIVNYIAKEYTYKMKNVPALKDEPYMSAARDYLQRVEFQLNSVQFPQQPVHNVQNTWPSLTKSLWESAIFGQQIKRNLLKNDAMNSILANAATPVDKMNAIFYHVQRSMTWDGVEDFYCTNVKESYNKKTGSSGDINLILLNLLNDAGIEAKPLLVSTRDHGIVNATYPFLSQFNNVMVLVNFGNEVFVLDASSKLNSPRLIPESVLGTEAYLADKENAQFVTLWNNKNTYRQFITLNGAVDAEGQLKGEAHVSSYDYGRQRRSDYVKEGKEKYAERYLQQSDNMKITDLEIENAAIDTLPLNQHFKFASALNSSGEYMFLTANMFAGLGTNPFTSDTRQSMVDFGYNQHYVLTGNITIPEGYEFEQPPRNMAMIMPDTSIIFRRIVEVKPGSIAYRITLEFRRPFYNPEEYPDFKEFYKLLFDKLSEQFVFKKKA